MRRLIHGHPGRRSAEAGLHVPPRRALRREAALQLQPGARARSEDLRRCRRTSAARCRRSRRPTRQQEQKWLLEAVKAYIGATKFRKYERMDEVLFRLAYLLTSVKKEDQAREFFHRLIKDYPNSKYIPDAYLSFAEFYFDKGEMDNALKFYEKVEQFPKSSVYPYAVYKKGWCYVNLGDYKTALETFVGVVRMTQEGKVNVSKAQQRGAREGSQEGHRQGVLARRRSRQGLGVLPEHGRRLRAEDDGVAGRALLGRGQVRRVERVYKKVIAQNMDSPRICEWQNKIVRNTLSAGNKKRPGPGDRAPRRRLRQGRRDEGRQEGPDGGVPQLLPRHVEGAGAHLAQGSAEDEEPATPTSSTSSSTRCSSTTSRRTRTPTRWASTTASCSGRCRTGRTRPSSTRRSSR